MSETTHTFAASELDPADPSPRDRRDELRTLLRDAVRTVRTEVMIGGDNDRRAYCPIETTDGTPHRIVIEGDGAITLLRRFLREAGLID